MPNPFKDWARMYGANKQFLESQGRPSSFLGQIGDIPNRIHEAADAGEIGMKMMRHSQLTNGGGGLAATVTVEGVWTVGSYMDLSPVLRIQGRAVRDDGSASYGAVFDEVVTHLHTARVQPGRLLAVSVDPKKSSRHGDRLDPHRSTRLATIGFHPGGSRARGRSESPRRIEQDAQQILWVVPHQVVLAVEFVGGPVRIIADAVVGLL